MAAEMRAAGIIAGFCPKGAKDAKAAFGGPRPPRPSRCRRPFRRDPQLSGSFPHFVELQCLAGRKISLLQAGAARVSRAFTVAVQNISAPWAGDKMERLKKHGNRTGRNRKLSPHQAPVEAGADVAK